MKYLPLKSTMNGLILDPNASLLRTSTAFLFELVVAVVLLVVVIAVLEVVVSSSGVSKKSFTSILLKHL